MNAHKQDMYAQQKLESLGVFLFSITPKNSCIVHQNQPGTETVLCFDPHWQGP